MNIQALIAALLPIGEEIASVFIHNPNSQQKFSVVVTTVNALEPVLAGVLGPKMTVEPPPGFVAAGTPSAHVAAEVPAT